MNKLKKLFRPRALASTVAAGMLLHSAVNVLAAGPYQVSACNQFAGFPPCVGCGGGQPCYSGNYLWCCWAGDSCYGGFQQGDFPWGTAWCYDSDWV